MFFVRACGVWSVEGPPFKNNKNNNGKLNLTWALNFVVLSGSLFYPHRGQRTRGKWISLPVRDGANPRALISKTS